MTMLPVQRKCDFQGQLLGLKLTRLMALAYTLPSDTEAKSWYKIWIVGDILDSSGKQQNEQSVGLLWCDYSLTSAQMCDIKVSLWSIGVGMINLRMMIFGSTEPQGYKGHIQWSTRKKRRNNFIFKTHSPLQRISGKREDADTLGQWSYRWYYPNINLAQRMVFLFLKINLEYFKHAEKYRKEDDKFSWIHNPMLSDPNHLPYLLQISLLFNEITETAEAPSSPIFYHISFHISGPPTWCWKLVASLVTFDPNSFLLGSSCVEKTDCVELGEPLLPKA